jgi:putative endonuclease
VNARSRAIGHGWEDYAAQILQEAGLQILARRYHCRLGEIDLIAAEDGCVVFVEVRYRSRIAYGGAAETVTHAKRRRVVAAARHFVMRHPGLDGHAMRFDVVAIERERTRDVPTTRWIRGAFEAE